MQEHPPDVEEVDATAVGAGVVNAGNLGTRGGDAGDLVERMRSGDRNAAAEFVTRFGTRIRRRIHGKLSPSMRRLFDSQEILSTLGRRLDMFVRSGKLEASNEAQLWTLVFRMAENALVDKARVFRRLRAVEGEDGEFARRFADRLRAREEAPEGVESELEAAIRSLPDQTDRAILSLWLTGTPHVATADCVGLSPAAVRQRWVSIRSRLRESLEAGAW